jgi:trans-2,3-dihydro-3-hydroxyanthranilate isomerase
VDLPAPGGPVTTRRDTDRDYAARLLCFTEVVATFRYVFADVFTDVPFAGNQLAVFTDAREIPEERLQPLAREINFAETVFVYPAAGEGHARIRIFTPTLELPFAGHPVLGTAFVLAQPLQLDEIRLETGAGVVPIRLERDGSQIAFGWMRQPPSPFEPYDRVEELLGVLGVKESGLPVDLYRQGPGHVMVELASPEAVAALRPNAEALLALGSTGFDCFARDGESWKSRVFVPAHGTLEDPATGSAAGPLALHLSRHGRIGFGDEIVIRQGVELGRPSTLHAVARSPEEAEVGGSAVVVARGEFRL